LKLWRDGLAFQSGFSTVSQYVETPIGKISFDKNGDVIGAGFAVFNIKNGKFVEMSAK